MKETLFIIFFGIFIYLGVSTVFGDSELMGSYGSVFASYNQHLFGYISFVYLFALLIPIYYLYKNTTLNFRKAQIAIASILLFLSTTLAQAMLVQGLFRGKLGADFVDFLSPYIGLFGLWVFWIMITLVSIVVLLDKTTQEISSIIIEFIKNRMPKPSLKPKKAEALSAENVYTHEEIHEVVEEITLESSFIEEESKEDIDKPAYLRKSESPTKEKKNIIDLVSKVKEQKNALIVDELEENTKLLETIEKGSVEKPKNFTLPSIKFLQKPDATSHTVDESEVDDKIRYLIEKLAHFKIEGDVVRTYAGPVVSTFEFKPAANVKVSKILNLQDDLAMALSAETIRIQAPIPGKDVVGIEIPNDTVDTIFLRELLDAKLFQESASPLTIALGKDIVGKPFITDLKKLPHLLIAGTTGSGKSVGINAMILSLLYKNSPDQLRLLMIDPKMLEFS
ncbi:MAG: DNA translocase FtsK, partial [Campylobacterota bacterium]